MSRSPLLCIALILASAPFASGVQSEIGRFTESVERAPSGPALADVRVQKARVVADGGDWFSVEVTVAAGEERRLARFTGHYVDRTVAISLDGKVLSVPRLVEPITKRVFKIGPFIGRRVADELAAALPAGELIFRISD